MQDRRTDIYIGEQDLVHRVEELPRAKQCQRSRRTQQTGCSLPLSSSSPVWILYRGRFALLDCQDLPAECVFSVLLSIRDSWLLATTYNSGSMNHVHIEPLPATLVLLSTPASGSVKPAPFRCQLGREDNVVKDDLVQDIQIKQFGIRLKARQKSDEAD